MLKLHPFQTGNKAFGNKKILGGKGYGLVLMCAQGMPVPPGFIIPTNMSVQYNNFSDDAKADLLDEIVTQVIEEYVKLSKILGYSPLVSVRSGAPISMPGMMDTILNVGLTEDTMKLWSKVLGDRAAMDSLRRLGQMFGTASFGIPGHLFEEILSEARAINGASTDSALSHTMLVDVCDKFWALIGPNNVVPSTVAGQLKLAIKTVFESWGSERAKTYRKIEGISDSMGTAVVIQTMVFGNTGYKSGTGVLFSRNPLTGEDKMFGEFLPNAQGEDVVAGVRTPHPVSDMLLAKETCWPKIYDELVKLCHCNEAIYGDMVDLEFTVQDGKLWVLQSRVGKRSGVAAFQIAHDMLMSGFITTSRVKEIITPRHYRNAKAVMVAPDYKVEPTMVGLPAGPGVATGQAVMSSDSAINCTGDCILVTTETTPDDIGGLNAAKGVLTITGGTTSHAAVVARGLGKACVVGCMEAGSIAEGAKITICGLTGRVWVNCDVPVQDGSDNPIITTIENVILTGSGSSKAKSVNVLHVQTVGDLSQALVTAKNDPDTIIDIREKDNMHAGSKDFLNWMGLGKEAACPESDIVEKIREALPDYSEIKVLCSSQFVYTLGKHVHAVDKAVNIQGVIENGLIDVDASETVELFGDILTVHKFLEAFPNVKMMNNALPRTTAVFTALGS